MTSIQIPSQDKVFDNALDKVVIITGGVHGIGEAAVRLLHAHGAKISILDVDVEAGEKLAKELGSRVQFFQGSVDSWNDQLNIFEQTVKRHGRLDIVLANAGIDEVAEDAFVDSFDDNGKLRSPSFIVLDVTLRGVLSTTKLALSYFRRLKTKGSLVATGSAASYFDSPGIPVYNSAKHGVLGLMRSLRDTLAAEGLIRANIVAPAFTDTRFMKHLIKKYKENNLAINTSEQAARAMIFLALNEEYHGKSIYVAGGTYTELEETIRATRPAWLGVQNTKWRDQKEANGILLGKQENGITQENGTTHQNGIPQGNGIRQENGTA